MSDTFQTKFLTAGAYVVAGFRYGYFVTEHDEPLPVRIRSGRVHLRRDCEFHGNPDCLFVEHQPERSRVSEGVSLIDPDMPRPLTPEQAAMRQLSFRLAQMEIAQRQRQVVTPRQIERDIVEAEVATAPEAEPVVEETEVAQEAE